jgi:hypothetical protein
MFDKHVLMWKKGSKIVSICIVCDFGLGNKLTQINSFNQVFKWEFVDGGKIWGCNYILQN